MGFDLGTTSLGIFMKTKIKIALIILRITCLVAVCFWGFNNCTIDKKVLPETNNIQDYNDKISEEFINGFITYDSTQIIVALKNENKFHYKAANNYKISNVFFDRIKNFISFNEEVLSRSQDSISINGFLNVWDYKNGFKWSVSNYSKIFSSQDEFGGFGGYYEIRNFNPIDTSGICLVNGPEYFNVAFLKHGKFVDHNNEGSDLATTLIAIVKDSVIVEDGYLFIININNDSTRLFNKKNLSSYKYEILKSMGYNADYYMKSLNKYAGYFSNWNNQGTALIYYEKSNKKKKGFLYVPSKNLTMKLYITENEIIPIWKD